jgi:hypothetical protein
MEPVINLLLVAATAATFAIAVLYTPRDRLFILLMIALPFCLAAFVLLLDPIYLGRLMSEPLGHALVTASLALLGVFLARNIIDLQV